QQQTPRVQMINYNPQIDRSFYMSKQPRPVGNFPGPPPMMPPGPFGPPFFGGPHFNMYDANMLPIQPPMLPPEMHPMGNPYMNVPHEWNPALAGPYGRPNVRSVWGESFNAPPEMGGGPSLFNQQPNTGSTFLSRPTQQNDNSPISQTGFENNNSLWTKNQWGNMTGGEGSSENKSNEQQLDQKRTNNRPSTFVPAPQQREGPFFNSNTSGLPMMPPHMFPGFVPPPISGPSSGPRRNNNNQIFPGPVPPEHVNLPRMNMMPPPIMGFPQQPTPLNGAIRPPKSSELFDPNNSTQASNVSVSTPDTILPTSQPPSSTSALVRSLSLSSNHSQGKNQSNHHRASSTSPSGTSKKKESGVLLFDYSMQVPYEGVKPSEANEPPQPNHIIELYDFAESDNLIDITFANATIKMIYPLPNSSNKRPTILAIFKTSREANKAMQNFKGVRFKIKTWEPLVKNNEGNVTPPTVVD
ncbi:11214_t:CDS:2, partial [Dentiscutata erythropus]